MVLIKQYSSAKSVWDIGSFKRIKCLINKVHLESKASGTPANSLPPIEFLLGWARLPQPPRASSRLASHRFALSHHRNPNFRDTCLVQFLRTFDIV